jgi:hypothetical protein
MTDTKISDQKEDGANPTSKDQVTTNTQNNGSGSETDSTKTENPNPKEGLNLSDEDFEKVFEDERLYKSPKFNKLRERVQKAETELEKIQKVNEEKKLKRLEKKGKTKELLETYKQKAEDAENRFKSALLDNRIQAEATKQGALDLEAVLKLIDRDEISVDEEGNVKGVEDAVKGLLESKSYLKGKVEVRNIGSGTNPSGDGSGTKTFTRSQVENPTFYRENEKDILEAMRHGKIIEDNSGSA